LGGKLLAVDLFAGAGGLSEGLRKAGYVKLANEIQKDAALTYRRNHPDTKLLLGDVQKMNETHIIPQITWNFDLIAGGTILPRVLNGARAFRSRHH
jgi:DNA (cytosine-5)-methyltransferase 1